MKRQMFVVRPAVVARNPVARAVARSAFRSAILDFQLRLRLSLRDGDDASGDIHAAISVIAVTMWAIELADRGDLAPKVSVLRGRQKRPVGLRPARREVARA